VVVAAVAALHQLMVVSMYLARAEDNGAIIPLTYQLAAVWQTLTSQAEQATLTFMSDVTLSLLPAIMTAVHGQVVTPNLVQ
jgi:hypothetical protein